MEFRFRVPQHWRARHFRYRLLIYRCVNCGTSHHNARHVCRKCRSSDLKPENLPRNGRLVAYTVVRSPPSGFEYAAPYIAGIVELEDGTRLFTQITDCEPEDLHEGMELEQVVRKIAEDGESKLIVYGYKFRPKIYTQSDKP